MRDQIKKYFIATRPWSFTMSLISVSVGTLLAAEYGSISWLWFFLTIFGITFFHAAANLLNDYFDTLYNIDQQGSPTTRYRMHPIISGMLTPRQVLGEAIIFLALTVVIGGFAAWLRSYHVLWIGVIGLLTNVFYTAGPLKIKYRAFGEFAVFMMWGPLMIEGAYAVQMHSLSLKALYISIPLGTLVALVRVCQQYEGYCIRFAPQCKNSQYHSWHKRQLSALCGTDHGGIRLCAWNDNHRINEPLGASDLPVFAKSDKFAENFQGENP